MTINIKEFMEEIPQHMQGEELVGWMSSRMLETAEAIKHENETGASVELVLSDTAMYLSHKEISSINFRGVYAVDILNVVAFSEVYNINTQPYINSIQAYDVLKEANGKLVELFWKIDFSMLTRLNKTSAALNRDLAFILMLSRSLLTVFADILHSADYDADGEKEDGE